MQAPSYICRSCLSRLREPWRDALLARQARWLSRAAQSPKDTQADREKPRFLIRKYDPYLSFRRYDPALGDNSPKPGRTKNSLAQVEARREQEFDVTNYPVQDEAFWDTFENVWNEHDEPVTEASPSGEPTTNLPLPADASGSKAGSRVSHAPKGGLTNRPRKHKRQSGRRKRIVQFQLANLIENSNNDDLARVKRSFRRWKRYFTSCWREMEAGKPPRNRFQMEKLRGLSRMCPTEALIGLDSVEAMRAKWQSLPEDGESNWPDLMISVLLSDPGRAHLVLEATFEESTTPQYAIRDTLHFLVRRLRQIPAEAQRETAEGLCDSIMALFKASSKGHIQIRQHTIFTLGAKLGILKLRAFYSALIDSGHPLHRNTSLQFARWFAKEPEHKDLAVDILQGLLRAKDFNIDTPVGASLCTSILSVGKGSQREKMAATPADLFERLLELGMRPNLITYTAIIRNLCLGKELGTAWEVLQLMMQHQHEPDANLYSILINGAKLCGDYDALHRIFGLAYSKGVRDPVICNDLLHAIALRSIVEAREKGLKPPRIIPAFRPMLQTYSKFFEIGPLQDLIPINLEDILGGEDSEALLRQWRFISEVKPLMQWLTPWGHEELLKPGAYTLAPMVVGYVRGLSDPYSIISFYSHFRNLLKSGNPAATLMIREQWTLVHDIVIKSLLEWPSMARVALDVLSDMLKDAIAAVESRKSEGGGEKPALARHPPPSVFTWSILLNGFMHRRYSGQGERILKMMRRYGVTPSLVTWNTMVAGYARDQRVNSTVDTLQRLERAGFSADDFTLRAFSYLRNKQLALDRMDKMIAKREVAKKRREMQAELDGNTQGLEGIAEGADGDEGELRSMANEVDGLRNTIGHWDRVGELMDGQQRMASADQ